MIRKSILNEITKRNTTQSIVANATKISLRTLNGFLSGNKQTISLESLFKIADYFQIPVEVLFSTKKATEYEIRYLSRMMKKFSEDERPIVMEAVKSTVASMYKISKNNR